MKSYCDRQESLYAERVCLCGYESSSLASSPRHPSQNKSFLIHDGEFALRAFPTGKAHESSRAKVEAPVKTRPARAQRSGSCGCLYGCWSFAVAYDWARASAPSPSRRLTDVSSLLQPANMRSQFCWAGSNSAVKWLATSSPRRSSAWSSGWSWWIFSRWRDPDPTRKPDIENR
jgi:hypothetical protein